MKPNGKQSAVPAGMKRTAFSVPYIKALDELGTPGVIEAIVSVFNNVDMGKEVVKPGFFSESLMKKYPKGVWMHDWKIPVAKTLEARELMPGDPLLPDGIKTLGGLYIKGQFNLDTQRGREAYSDLKFGTVDEFSIGYSVDEYTFDKEKDILYLEKGPLYEWSPVLVGMNPDTALMSLKDIRHELKAAPPKTDARTKGLGDLSANDLWALLEQELNEDFGAEDADWWDERYRVQDVVPPNVVIYTRGYDPDGPLFMRMFTVTDGNDVTWGDETEVVRTTRYLPITESPDAPDTDDLITKDGSFAMRDEGKRLVPRTGLRFPDHTDAVRSAVKGWVARAHGIHGMYRKEGRVLNSGNRQMLGDMRDCLQGHADDLAALLDATDPDKAAADAKDVERELMRFLAFEAHVAGVI